jgi:hypothetical protein
LSLFQNSVGFKTASIIHYSASPAKDQQMQEVFRQSHLGAFFAPQKTGLSGGSGRKSATRIYFWSFAYGKTPHWIQAWSLRSAQTPEAKPQRGFATAPLQSLAQQHPFGVNAIQA